MPATDLEAVLAVLPAGLHAILSEVLSELLLGDHVSTKELPQLPELPQVPELHSGTTATQQSIPQHRTWHFNSLQELTFSSGVFAS